MPCQTESEGSSDGAGEGEAGEGGAAEELSVSVEGITNLISGVLSECMFMGKLIIDCKAETENSKVSNIE